MDIFGKYELEMKELEAYISDFPWGDRAAYSNWVAQTYYFVLHSTRLFASAAARCEIDNNKIHFRMIEHLHEEKGHEFLALGDLKAMNVDIRSLPELPETSSLYQIQYYWIEHNNPLSFFGYLSCLEGLAVRKGREIYEKVLESHGGKAANFLRVHIEEDEDHLAEVFKYMSDFSEKAIEQVFLNLSQSANLYLNMLRHISRSNSVENSRIDVA